MQASRFPSKTLAHLSLATVALYAITAPCYAQYDQIQDEGSNVAQETTLNLVGSAVECVDSGSTTECKVEPFADADTIRFIEDFTTGDAGDRIKDCLDALTDGGICDARGLTGSQTISAVTWENNSHATLLLGPTQFTVTGTITIKNAHGFRLVGTSGAGSNPAIQDEGTTFLWDGVSTDDLLLLEDLAQSEFEHFRIIYPTGSSGRFAVHLINGSASGVGIVTPQYNTFSHITIAGQADNLYESGFFMDNLIDTYGSTNANNDQNTFYSVQVIKGYSHSGFRMEGYNQHANAFYSCRAFGGWEPTPGNSDDDAGQYGVYASGGTFFSWKGHGGFIGMHRKADFEVSTVAGTVIIDGANSEKSARFLFSGYSNNGGTITVSNSRYAGENLHSDGRAISFSHDGVLTVIGSLFSNDGDEKDLSLYCNTPSGDFGCTGIGNIVYSDLSNPFVSESGDEQWSLLANQRTVSGTSTTRHDVPDSFANAELHVGTGQDEDWAMTFDQGTGTDARLAWDDSSSALEFDFDATLDDAGDVVITAGRIQTPVAKFPEQSTAPTCSSGDYHVWADSSSSTLRKCENGTASTLDTGAKVCGSASVDPSSITALSASETSVTATGVLAQDACSCSPRGNWGDDVVYQGCFSTTDNQLRFRLYNAGTTTDPSSVTVDYCCNR